MNYLRKQTLLMQRIFAKIYCTSAFSIFLLQYFFPPSLYHHHNVTKALTRTRCPCSSLTTMKHRKWNRTASNIPTVTPKPCNSRIRGHHVCDPGWTPTPDEHHRRLPIGKDDRGETISNRWNLSAEIPAYM